MKKLSLFLAMLITGAGVFAQCVINTSNTTTGITPSNPSDTIIRGIIYSQTLQLHAPATYSGTTVDSIHISSITGAPSGITYVINPASGTILGGGNGAICFSGITGADTGAYPLTLNGTAYFTFFNNHSSLPLSQLNQFGYSFYVADSVPALFPPVASFTGDSIACQSGFGQFTDLTTGNPTGWSWTFDGGSPPSSNIADPLVNYPDTGVYTVKLVVSNAAGADSITKTIHVFAPPVVTLSAMPDSEQVYDASGTIIAFGDGGMPPYTYAWSTGDTVSDTISQLYAGQYFVTITDSHGCFTTAGTQIDTAPPVIAYFIADTIGCTNQLITFTDESAYNPTAWSWSIEGTDATGNESQFSYSFTDSGTYSVKLVVSNGLGTDSITKIIHIYAPPAVNVVFAPGSEALHDSSGIAIAQVSGGLAPYSYTWSNFGSSTDTLSHLPPGHYFAIVTDHHGCLSTAGGFINIAPPVAAFLFDTVMCANTPVTFTSQAFNEPQTWGWVFTGATPSASADTSPTVSYATAGDYPVKLVVSSAGGSDSITQIIHIKAPSETSFSVYLACGDSALFNGQYYSHSTTQTQTLTGVYGCDSVVTMYLYVTDTLYASGSICPGDSLLFNGSWINTEGTYTTFKSGNNSCDSLLVFNLSFKTVAPVTFTWDSMIALGDVTASGFTSSGNDTAGWCPNYFPWHFALTGGSPAGGFYSGNDVLNDTLSPTLSAFGATDTITYTYVDNNQCSSKASKFLIGIVCEGITETGNTTALQLYPNPAADYLNVSCQGYTGTGQIKVTDVSGRVVENINLSTGTGKAILDTRALGNGLYFINLQSGNTLVATGKFVVLHSGTGW